MQDMLMAVNWDVDPVFFSVFGFEIRYYGLLWGAAFLVGYVVLKRMWSAEKVDVASLDKVLIWTMIGGVLGARFGHVFFYGPYFTPAGDGFFDDPISILNIRGGGMASHGGALGILITIYILVRREKKKFDGKYFLWILDRVAIGSALGAFFIRMGNLMNHEIVGDPTDSAFGFIFSRVFESDGTNIARHPTQLYEAICYLFIFFILMYMYWKTKTSKKGGMLFGWFLVLLFTARFFIEFLKVQQTHLVENPALQTGQWLSIPLVLVGIVLIMRGMKKPVDEPAEEAKESDA
jgi:phosphatidylglycerol:prolipoprotein diacylglycerol transferase